MAYRARPSMETIRAHAVANPAIEHRQFSKQYGEGSASEFAKAKEAEGFKVRQTKNKLGPRNAPFYMYNVRVYAA
jgi:hypothetical protein